MYARLDRIRKIRDKDFVTITTDQELEDVVEIFSRLNSRGTRVTEADIYLGIVAARAPGWVRDTFLPYLKTLADAGFRKLPRQGDSGKGELLASSWARYMAGGRPANASWGRSSL